MEHVVGTDRRDQFTLPHRDLALEEAYNTGAFRAVSEEAKKKRRVIVILHLGINALPSRVLFLCRFVCLREGRLGYVGTASEKERTDKAAEKEEHGVNRCVDYKRG